MLSRLVIFHQMFLSFRRGNGVNILPSGSGLNIWHLSLTGTRGEETTCQHRRHKRLGFDPCVRMIPCRRACQPTPLFLPGEYHRQRAWRATVHRVAKSQTGLKWLSTHSLKDLRTSFPSCAHFVNRLHPERHGLLREHKLESEVTSLPDLQHFAEHFERTVEQKKAIRQINSR